MGIYLKDPDAILDYGFNWGLDPTKPRETPWLASGETITESTWIIPTGLTWISDSFAANGGTTVWLFGGVAGISYVIINHIVTSVGREDDRSHTIKVRER